jgi:hypothetical protein
MRTFPETHAFLFCEILVARYRVSMETIEFTMEGWLLRADEAVLEVFSRASLGSLRLPFAFVSVTLEDRKNGVLRVRPGLAPDPSVPFYGGATVATGGMWMIDVPLADQPALRAFLDAVAARTGRQAA